MKRKTMIIVVCLVLGIVGVVGTAMAAGPAPNAGDCNPDGSGFENKLDQMVKGMDLAQLRTQVMEYQMVLVGNRT